jgi:hypothetical protein
MLVLEVAGKRGIVITGYSPVNAPRKATMSSTSACACAEKIVVANTACFSFIKASQAESQ